MGKILQFRRMLLGRTGQRNHEVRIGEVYGVSWGLATHWGHSVLRSVS